MRRTLRAQEKECDDAAQEFANAQILYTCEVYSVAVIRKHHDELGSFKRQKMFLDDQLTIMTTGWGYSDLALLKHWNNTDPCSVCDSRESDRRLHLLEHVLKVRARVEERGGKPPAPPHATIFLRALPPVLTGAPVDPKCNPIFNYNKKVEERAERRVQSGQKQASITPPDELEQQPLPAMDDGLIGREVQYMCKTQLPGETTWKMTRYLGVILSVSRHELVPTPAACATAKKGKKGKRKGKSVAEPPKKYLPSVRAKWITQHENGRVESVFLDPARFNRPSAVEFGWYIDMDHKEDEDEAVGLLADLEDKAIKAQYCCFKREL